MVEPEKSQTTVWLLVHAGLVRLYAHKHTPAHLDPPPPPPHTHTRTHARTHRQICILIAFPWHVWFRERALMIHYTYVACLVDFLSRDRINPIFAISFCLLIRRTS
jgi:hypothetical protein